MGEDRLAGARLARDRVQAGVELELGLPDQDEVLDAQPAEHGCMLRRPPAGENRRSLRPWRAPPSVSRRLPKTRR